MNFKDMLDKLSVLAEESSTRKVKGKAYGGSEQKDDDDKPEAKKEAPKKRGRPKKDAGADGETPEYKNAASLQSWIVGNVPKKSKELDKLPKKTHKLKEAEQVQIVPAKQDTQIIKQGNKTLGAVTNPQLAQQLKQSIGKGEVTLAGDDQLKEADSAFSAIEKSLRQTGEFTAVGVDGLDMIMDYAESKNLGQHEYIPGSGGEFTIEFPRSPDYYVYKAAGHKMVTLVYTGKKESRMYEGKKPKLVKEKAVSKKQQKFMGMVHAAQKGEKPASKEVGDVAKSMKKGDVKDFASTKHKGLPEKKKTTESAKPDFLDMDKDGNKKEPMKKAVADKKKTVEAKGSKPDFLDMDKDGNKKEPMKKAVADKKTSGLKESKMAQLDDDLKNLSDAAFKKEYKCTKAEMRKKLSQKKPATVNESISLRENTSAMELIISRYKHEVKKFINGGDLDSDLYEALYDYYFDMGEMPYGVAKGRSGDPYEWVTQRFDQDVHDFVDTEELDEGRHRRQPGLNPRDPEWIDFDDEDKETEPYNTDDDMYDAYSDFSPDTDYERMNEGPRDYDVPAVWRKHREHGAKGRFPASLDDVMAPGDNLSDLRNVQKRNKELDDPFGMSGTKDAQFESWDRELNNLLNEGLTVSFNSGQENTPDSVSINATEEDADEMLSLLKNSGLGIFGGEEEAADQGFSSSLLSTQPEEHDEESPDVVDDADDMLSIIKRLTGSTDGESSDSAEEDHDEHEAEGSSDEGFDDNEEQVHEGDHEMCQECGMTETECKCDEEQVEEAFQNEVDTDTQDTEYMMNTITGGINRQKQGRAAGDVKTIEVAEDVSAWVKLAGIK